MAGWTGTLLCPATISGTSFDVEADFGAVGDGITNDRAAIQSALDAIVSGGILNFGVGKTYLLGASGVTPTITWTNPSGAKLVGNGSTLKAADNSSSANGFHLFRIQTGINVVVDTLHIDGNRANRTLGEFNAHNWQVRGGTGISFINCISKNAVPDNWILIARDGFADNVLANRPTNVLFSNCIGDNGYRQGVTISSGLNVQFLGGEFKNTGSITGINPSAGIDIEPEVSGLAANVENVLIRGVNFSANRGPNVQMTQNLGPLTKVTMEGCRSDGGSANPRTDSNFFAAGIVVDGNDVLVKTNTFEAFSYTGSVPRACINIQTSALSRPVSNCAVDGNSFNTVNVGSATIYVHSVSGTGNSVTNNTGFALSDVFVSNNNPSGTTATNNNTSGVRTDPSPTPPWTTGLSHCSGGGGGGGGAINTEYIEQLTRQTVTNNATPQNVLRLTHTPNDSTTWWYFATALMDDSSITVGNNAIVRVRQSTAAVDLANLVFLPADITDNLQFIIGSQHTYGVAPGSQNIDIDLSTEGANTAGLDDLRLFGIEKDFDDRYAASDGETTSTSSVYATKVTMTETLTGDYLFICTAEVNGNPTSRIQVRADKAGTKFGSADIIMRNPSALNWQSWGTAFRLTGLSGSQTIFIEFARDVTGSAVKIRKARIFAIKLGRFANNYYAENRARTTTTSTTPIDKTTLTQVTAAASHIIFGGMIVDGSDISNSSFAELEEDAVSISTQDAELTIANEFNGFMTFARHTLTAASHTWKTQFWSEAAALTTGADQSFISAIELTAAATPVTVQVTGFLVSVVLGITDPKIQTEPREKGFKEIRRRRK